MTSPASPPPPVPPLRPPPAANLPRIRNRPRFAPPRAAPRGRWRRVPPAIFPPLAGAVALAAAWLAGVQAFALPVGLAQLFAGMIAALAVFALAAYGAKLVRRPTVLVEELGVLPGHIGVAAGVMTVDLLAIMAAEGGAQTAAKALLIAALVLHAALIAALLTALRRASPEQRRPSPAWQLSLGGLSVPAFAAALLGWPMLAAALVVPAAVAWLLTVASGVRQLATHRIAAPLRPLLALHVVPLAALAAAAMTLGLPLPGTILAGAALMLTLGLAVFGPWLLSAGFSVMSGAISVPAGVAALLSVVLWHANPSEITRLIAGLLLIAATLIVLPLLALIWRDWARGRLAVRTNAAIA